MLSIRKKFVFYISILFIFIGILIYCLLANIIPPRVTAQILKREMKIAQYLADDAKRYLLTNDNLALSFLLHKNLDKLEDAQYLFVQARDGNIISSTFDSGFPQGLLHLNIRAGNHNSVIEFLKNGRKVYDIGVPILGGELGSLHLGVSLGSSQAEIAEFSKINYYVAGVIFLGLGIGILLFTVLGFFLSRRIIKLKNYAERIGRGDLEAKIEIKTRDELGVLANSFNQMALDLKEKLNAIKRLSYLEERSRIAIEFHDGLAQDLANIIKRLELCERLFKIEPTKAFEELSSLRDSTKDILDRTRQLIANLKSPADIDFNLLAKLNSYIKDYQLQNAVSVDLEISRAVDKIPADKAKSIFYIIAEALANVKKHSHAKNVLLKAQFNNTGGLNLKIEDDGRGFDVAEAELLDEGRGKFGLIGMRQRASLLGGTFIINSKAGEGTDISVYIPN